MASRLRRDKISAVDTAWLRMDRPHNLMMICGVLMFEGRVEFARLRQVIDERLLVFRRFRQRAVELPGFCVWETDRAVRPRPPRRADGAARQGGQEGAAGAGVAA